MKKFSITTICVICFTLAFAMTAYSENGRITEKRQIEKERQVTDPGVFKNEIHADGRVTVDGIKFRSMTDYFQSDHFKRTHKRCKPVNVDKDIERDPGRFDLMGSAADCTKSCTTIKSEYAPQDYYTIPVVFHIIHKTDGTGNISDSRIINQIEALNEDYGAFSGTLGARGHDTKIYFELAAITRTANNNWFYDNNVSGYKLALGWDQSQYLNVYVNTASMYLGYSYYPQDYAGTWRDGVVLLYSVCGGRNEGSEPYNQGRTLVHEVGHYLGLYHTFEDSCGTGYCAGDRINDTNSESGEHYDCINTATCSTYDPIHNYMNYTDDRCMWEFTPEQANRAVCCLVNYRPDLYY